MRDALTFPVDDPCAAAAHCGELRADGTPVPPDGSALGSLPTLILAGTRKGGTTTLAELLLAHPHVVAPTCRANPSKQNWPVRVRRTMCVWDKEVRYFSRGPEAGADLCWYRRLYPCVPVGSPHVGFDGSPDYLVMGDAKIRTMAATLPHIAKLIFLLRDPAARFYSAYNMGMNEHLRFGRRRSFKSVARGGEGRKVLWVPAGDAADDANRTADLGETHAENLGGNLGGHDRNARRADYDAFASSLDRYISCAPTCADEPSVVAMFFDHGMCALPPHTSCAHVHRHMRRCARLGRICCVHVSQVRAPPARLRLPLQLVAHAHPTLRGSIRRLVDRDGLGASVCRDLDLSRAQGARSIKDGGGKGEGQRWRQVGDERRGISRCDATLILFAGS